MACVCTPIVLTERGKRTPGYQPTTLYKINRVACLAIAERFTAYRRELREKRLQGYREEIRRIALSLQAERVAPTQRHIARYLAQPAILRDPKVRELLREVCREAGKIPERMGPMRDTHFIFIEGIMGSGKSTTARFLFLMPGFFWEVVSPL
jgi:hypothetical protein